MWWSTHCFRSDPGQGTVLEEVRPEAFWDGEHHLSVRHGGEQGLLQPTDQLTSGGVAVVLASVAMVATYLPALRASRIDPVLAVQGEGKPGWKRRTRSVS